jgi:hypothetical protein
MPTTLQRPSLFTLQKPTCRLSEPSTLAYEVDLIAKGVVTSDTAITQGRTGPRYFFVTDPDGIQVEISEDARKL